MDRGKIFIFKGVSIMTTRYKRYRGWKHQGVTGYLWHLAEKYSGKLSNWIWRKRWTDERYKNNNTDNVPF